MPHKHPIIAVYSGSFDPVTYGHIDVVQRGAKLFNRLVVGIGKNPDKEELFTQDERLGLLKPHLRGWPNVKAETYDGLTIDFVHQCGARVLLRGIRDLADLSNELQQANVNLLIGGVETVFLLTGDQHVLTSSTYIKQVYLMGGRDRARIMRLVPPNVVDALARRLGGANGRGSRARTK